MFHLLMGAAYVLLLGATTSWAADKLLGFSVKQQILLRELHPDWCWFHPRAAAIPPSDPEGRPTVIVTLQKHLKVSDFYSGLYFMRSDDGGRTWSPPVLPPELDWRQEKGEIIAVADVTPGWHAPSGRLLAIGIKVRYSPQGEQLLDKPRSHNAAYAVYNPKTNSWTPWRFLEMPDLEDKFYQICPGCVQWLVNADGTILLPIYFGSKKTTEDALTTVLHCSFDGEKLTYLRHGDELTIEGGRGLCEPSLARYRGRYYLTLRNDYRAYVTTSEDGLHWAPIKPWTFDDGSELGSYNTQAHWLVHSEGLFLCYTRRGANNDHIVRHRAPLFIAQVDTEKLCVLRATEQILIPERGVMLGNFGACAIDEGESWVTDAEFAFGPPPHPRGADGTVFIARVQWARPNRLLKPVRIICLGDSITKGVRPGVLPEQTFAWLVEKELLRRGYSVEVLNRGIGGERTDQALLRLDRDVIALRPHIVLLMYGTNDSYVDPGARAPRLSAAQFRQNLFHILQQLQAHKIQPVLMTAPCWGAQALNGRQESPNILLGQFMDLVRALARELQVPLVDHFALWSEKAAAGQDIGAWTTDQCHPNPAGQAVMAEAILPVVAPLVQKAQLAVASAGGRK